MAEQTPKPPTTPAPTPAPPTTPSPTPSTPTPTPGRPVGAMTLEDVPHDE